MKQENHTRSDSILVSFYWKMIFYLFLANSNESNDVCVLLLVEFLFQILLFVSLLDEFVDVVSFLYCLMQLILLLYIRMQIVWRFVIDCRLILLHISFIQFDYMYVNVMFLRTCKQHKHVRSILLLLFCSCHWLWFILYYTLYSIH